MRRSVRYAGLVALVAAPAAAAPGCFGATQVTLDITTDLACDADAPTTSISAGEPGAAAEAPVAETTDCRSRPGQDAEIGSLAIVPSGDRDGRAAVSVVVGVKGTSTRECQADPKKTNCIVARRSFSFRKHAALRLPIRILRDCLGQECGPNETCVAGGRCVSAEVECVDDDCRLPEERADGGVVDTSDAARPTDANVAVDAPVVDQCVVPDGDALVSLGGDIPSVVAASGTHLFWVDAGGKTVRRVPKTGGVIETAYVETEGSTVASLAAVGANPVVVRRTQKAIGADYAVLYEEKTVASPGIGDAAFVFAVTPRSKAPEIYLGHKPGFYYLNGGALALVEDNAAPVRLVGVDGQLYTYDGAVLRYYAAPPGPSVGPSVPAANVPLEPRLAANATTAFAGGKASGAGSGGLLVKLNGASAPSLVATTAIFPTALAADESFVYWIGGPQILRAVIDPGMTVGMTQVVSSPVDTVLAHLEVDLGTSGCIYYWSKAGSGPAELRVARKPGAFVVDAAAIDF